MAEVDAKAQALVAKACGWVAAAIAGMARPVG